MLFPSAPAVLESNEGEDFALKDFIAPICCGVGEGEHVAIDVAVSRSVYEGTRWRLGRWLWMDISVKAPLSRRVLPIRYGPAHSKVTRAAAWSFGRPSASRTAATLPDAARLQELSETFQTSYQRPRADNVLGLHVWLKRVRR